MYRYLVIVPILFLAGLPALSQAPKKNDIPYTIQFDPKNDVEKLDRKDGVFIKMKFEVKGSSTDYAKYKIQIFEDGQLVETIKLPPPGPTGGMSVVLCLDTSLRMKEYQPQVRNAVDAFFKSVKRVEDEARTANPDAKSAECGLILFNNVIRQTVDLSLDREPLRKAIKNVQPSGGNACLDAAARAIDMLKNVPVDKARSIVLISNGLDSYSKATKDKVIADAVKHNVTIHTIGIGKATEPQILNTVMVLDHSGSMAAPANDKESEAKITGLHKSAAAFVENLPPTARTALIPFGSDVGVDVEKGTRVWPKRFSTDGKALTEDIKGLKASGETALFDAVFAALETLDADDPRAKGKRVVVAMTDGIDNVSRRGPEEVVQRARDAKVPLFMLGFGREKELDAKTMTQMAEQTGGEYFHAKNQQALLEFFKELSHKINDQGIDETTLREIAVKTPKGTYSHAQDASALELAMTTVGGALVQKHDVVFKSLRQVADGTMGKITWKLIRASGSTGTDDPGTSEVLDEQSANLQRHGVVIAQSDHLVYLALLGVIGTLIALPSFLRRTPTGT
jgi:uncharacterized protein YegL